MLTIAVIAFWFFELRPVALGGDAELRDRLGNLDEPAVPHRRRRDRAQTRNYKVHDIVAYKVPKPNPQAGLEVIHRLIGGNGTTGWTVKGDNRTAADL